VSVSDDGEGFEVAMASDDLRCTNYLRTTRETGMKGWSIDVSVYTIPGKGYELAQRLLEMGWLAFSLWRALGENLSI